MSKWHLSRIAVGVVLTMLLCSAAAAQGVGPVLPDAGVIGSGEIQWGVENQRGIFDISVTSAGGVLYGGFRFSEVDVNGNRTNLIVSSKLETLHVSGNFATVTATGYWNNMPAVIWIEALDDLAGDNLKITAKPIGMLPVIYERQGGVVKGDIRVFGQSSVSYQTKGDGEIAVLRNTNTGRFSFYGQNTAAGVNGKILYAELDNRRASIVSRPVVQIQVPMVSFMKVEGNVVTLAGVGALNGRPAQVKVVGVDNRQPWLISTDRLRPDWFSIEATPAENSSSLFRYYASGFLTVGDIAIYKAVSP